MSEYEFTESENRQFLTFSQSLIFLSVSLLFSGVILIIQGIIPPTNISDIVTGVVFIVISISLFFPVQYFQNIIVNTGSDIAEFMKGFTILSLGLTFVIGATGLLLVTIVVGLIQSVL